MYKILNEYAIIIPDFCEPVKRKRKLSGCGQTGKVCTNIIVITLFP